LEGMGDSLDLIPIGGWRGSGRKSKWVSPWLMATFDPVEGLFGSVCRVMSGFTDQFYRNNTIRYLGAEIGTDKSCVLGDNQDDHHEEDDAGSGATDGSEDDEACLDDGHTLKSRPSKGFLLSGPAPGIQTHEHPEFWFDPTEVWEIRGADITLSPKHMSALGIVDAQHGLSVRFPRFIRKRPDKRIADATTPEQLVAMFQNQTQQHRQCHPGIS